MGGAWVGGVPTFAGGFELTGGVGTKLLLVAGGCATAWCLAAARRRCTTGFGTVPSVPGTDTGTTETTLAGAAVLACTGGSWAALAVWCLAAHPAANAARNTTATMTKAITSRERERPSEVEIRPARALRPRS